MTDALVLDVPLVKTEMMSASDSKPTTTKALALKLTLFSLFASAIGFVVVTHNNAGIKTNEQKQLLTEPSMEMIGAKAVDLVGAGAVAPTARYYAYYTCRGSSVLQNNWVCHDDYHPTTGTIADQVCLTHALPKMWHMHFDLTNSRTNERSPPTARFFAGERWCLDIRSSFRRGVYVHDRLYITAYAHSTSYHFYKHVLPPVAYDGLTIAKKTPVELPIEIRGEAFKNGYKKQGTLRMAADDKEEVKADVVPAAVSDDGAVFEKDLDEKRWI